MANSDKNILITPFVGGITQPQIAFVGQGNDPIYLRVLDGVTGTGATAGGALSVEGSAGQLFSIVNRLGTGSIFSVNDISGIPSIDVDANGTIVFAGFTGNVGIGVTAPTNRLSVAGNISATGTVTGSRLVYALNGLTGGVTLIAGANITLTSSAAGITIASTASGSGGGVSTLNGLSGGITLNAGTGVTITSSVAGGITIAASGSGDNVVTSFNGRTGAVQGVSAAVAGTGISVSGATGAVTITNIGVQSFNGLTGAVGGVTTSAANTFSAKQTFSLGIEVSNGATFSTPVNVAHNITQTGPTRGISAEGFLYVGLGATFGTSVATNSIVNRVAGATLTIATSTSGNVNIIPIGNVFVAPTPSAGSGGDSPKITVQGTDNAAGQVQISGGNLYLGSKTNALSASTPCVILFGNSTNAFTTTLEASTASSNKTITMPNETGTVALETKSNARGWFM